MVGLGVLLLPLPGPGTAIIAAGLAILGREFPAARRLLDRSLRVLQRVIRLDPLGRRAPSPDPGDVSGEPGVSSGKNERRSRIR